MACTRACSVLLAATCAAGSAFAQDPDPTPQNPATAPTAAELAREIQQLREQLEKNEQQRGADRERLEAMQQRLEEIEQSQEPLEPPIPTLTPDALGQGNLLNPTIAVIGDLVGSLSNSDSNKYNRFALREIEIDARAAIAPWADGVLIVAFGEEIEEQIGGDISIENVVVIEEGYVDFHTLPLDLALKAGKFRNLFGRNNLLHLHDLPQVDRPPVVQAFLGPEGISTVGASLGWIVPNPFDEYVELRGEIVNADGGDEAPLLGGPNSQNPAALAHLKWFTDAGETGNFELGGSYLYSKNSDRAQFDSHVLGVDASYMWFNPEATRSVLVQAELFWADADLEDEFGNGFHSRSWGTYAFAQYQFALNWYAGARGDYTEFPLSPGDYLYGGSPYITWYLTEFLRVRAQYQHNEFLTAGIRDSEDNFFLNLTFTFGGHPPHPYWVNR